MAAAALVFAGPESSSRAAIRQELVHPNIILIVSDDQSFESVQKMPYLRSVTAPEGGWDRFDNAFINNATCCPSRATIFTGLYSHHHGIEATGGAPAYDDSDTIATRLQAAGYATGLIGKYHLGKVGANVGNTYIPPGWNDWEEFAHNTSGWYYNYRLNVNGTLVTYGSNPGDYSTDVLRDKALAFIDANSSDPFFLVYAPRAPHNDWTAAPRYAGHYKNEPVVHPPNFNEQDMSDKPAWWRSQLPRQVSNVDTSHRREWDTLLALDDAVEAIQGRVSALGLMQNTVIIFMTDNGHAFGEHRYTGKACAYDECSRTPLIVKYGDATGGRIFPQLIGNEDLAPTIADLAGASAPTPSDGQSFASLLRSGTPPPDWQNEVLLHGYDNGDTDGDQQGHPPTFWGLRTPAYKYVETEPAWEVELYDLAQDPYELNNVADDPGYADVRNALAARLMESVFAGPQNRLGTASVDGSGNLEFDAGTRARNEVTVSANGSFWTLSDTGTPVVAGAGCEQVRVSTVRCAQAGATGLVINGGDLDDTITTPNGVNATIDGGVGNDVLTAADGNDVLRGGIGKDVVDGGTGADFLDGGDSADAVTYATRSADQPVAVDLTSTAPTNGGPEDGPANARDTIINVENVSGGVGADLITGNNGPNELSGGAGADWLVGLAGNDTIRASGDGGADDLNCGGGNDTVFVDAIDTFPGDGADACESWVFQVLDHFKIEAAGGGKIGNQQAGVPFPVKITAQDANNNTVTGFNGTVDVSSNRSCSAGCTTAAFSAGVLSSHSLTLGQGGTGSTISAVEIGDIPRGTSNSFTVYAADGSGSVAVKPVFVGNGSSSNTLTFTYTAATGGMSNGTVTITVPGGWPAPSTTGIDAGYSTANAGSLSVSGRTITVSGVNRSGGQTIAIVYGSKASGGSGATAPSMPGSASWPMQEKSVSRGSLTDVTPAPSVNVLSVSGSGSLHASPTTVTKSSMGNTITFAYTAATGGMSNGTVTITVPSGWSAPTTTAGIAGYTAVSSGNASVSGRTITVQSLTLSIGQTFTVTYGSKAGGSPGSTAPSTTGAQTWTAKQRSSSSGTLTTLGTSPSITVNP